MGGVERGGARPGAPGGVGGPAAPSLQDYHPVRRLTRSTTSCTSSTRNRNAAPKNVIKLTTIAATRAHNFWKNRKCSHESSQQKFAAQQTSASSTPATQIFPSPANNRRVSNPRMCRHISP